MCVCGDFVSALVFVLDWFPPAGVCIHSALTACVIAAARSSHIHTEGSPVHRTGLKLTPLARVRAQKPRTLEPQRGDLLSPGPEMSLPRFQPFPRALLGVTPQVRVGLLTYPVLMAADILLYQVSGVKVAGWTRLQLTRACACTCGVRRGRSGSRVVACRGVAVGHALSHRLGESPSQ